MPILSLENWRQMALCTPCISSTLILVSEGQNRTTFMDDDADAAAHSWSNVDDYGF